MDSLLAAEDVEPTGIGELVRAAIALRDGRADAGLEHLHRAREADYGILRAQVRLILADTYTALGRYAEAAAHYDSLSSTYGMHYLDYGLYGPLRPIAHRRAADAYLASADTSKAIEHLAAFSDLWKNADPDPQHLVAESRQRLAELMARAR
jgi:tetratricopeptide (TPR) repeat protein